MWRDPARRGYRRSGRRPVGPTPARGSPAPHRRSSRRLAGVPRIGQRVRKKPAPGSLDTADDVAPHRLHERSLPRAQQDDKAIFATPRARISAQIRSPRPVNPLVRELYALRAARRVTSQVTRRGGPLKGQLSLERRARRTRAGLGPRRHGGLRHRGSARQALLVPVSAGRPWRRRGCD